MLTIKCSYADAELRGAPEVFDNGHGHSFCFNPVAPFLIGGSLYVMAMDTIVAIFPERRGEDDQVVIVEAAVGKSNQALVFRPVMPA